MKYNLTARERDTVLAALRLWQSSVSVGSFLEIAENGRQGRKARLDGDEIDSLCERINE